MIWFCSIIWGIMIIRGEDLDIKAEYDLQSTTGDAQRELTSLIDLLVRDLIEAQRAADALPNRTHKPQALSNLETSMSPSPPPSQPSEYLNGAWRWRPQEELTNLFRFYRIFAGALALVLVFKIIVAFGFFPPVKVVRLRAQSKHNRPQRAHARETSLAGGWSRCH